MDCALGTQSPWTPASVETEWLAFQELLATSLPAASSACSTRQTHGWRALAASMLRQRLQASESWVDWLSTIFMISSST